MIPEKAFNRKIQSYLNEIPNSSASDTIRFIQSQSNRNVGFYGMFDDFAFKLGLNFNAVPFYNERNDKLMGYIPYLVFSNENKFGIEKGEQRISSTPIKLDKCYEMIAKEVLYKIQAIPNLEKVIGGE